MRMQTIKFLKIVSLATKSTAPRSAIFTMKYYSSNPSMYNDEQVPYYTAKDIEFAPNRAKDVQQNNVEETAFTHTISEECAKEVTSSESIEEHTKAYRADSSVNLYSVMQSNVPDPFMTQEKAPTHLNMPGGSSTRNYKYISDKMQIAHHSRQ